MPLSGGGAIPVQGFSRASALPFHLPRCGAVPFGVNFCALQRSLADLDFLAHVEDGNIVSDRDVDDDGILGALRAVILLQL
jgi:hypothetical protein